MNQVEGQANEHAEAEAPRHKLGLSAVIVCFNEETAIARCLESVAFCDEVVVVDSGSTDDTRTIAERLGARVLQRPFVSMNDQKDFARRQATTPWVLNVDADEVVSSHLRDELRELLSSDGVDASIGAFRVPFRNYFRGTWVKSCGYYPDRHIRLVRRERAHWDSEAPVHDLVRVEGAVADLEGHIDHYSFDSVGDFVEKANRYASQFAEHAHRHGKTAGAGTIFSHSAYRFFRAYFLQAGFTEGALGLTIAGLQAYMTFQKYVRLWELTRWPAGDGGEDDGAR